MNIILPILEIKKDYEIEKVLHLVPEELKSKLYYCKVDLTPYNIQTYNESILSLCK